MKMFTLYTNSEDSELKIKIEELILNLYKNYCDVNNNCFKVYYEKALSIIENEENNNNNLKLFGIIILSLLLNIQVDFIDINKIIKVLNINIKQEILLMEKYIENKMNNYDYLLMSNNNKIMLNQNTKEKKEENKMIMIMIDGIFYIKFYLVLKEFLIIISIYLILPLKFKKIIITSLLIYLIILFKQSHILILLLKSLV